jgi:MFS family permease
MKRANSRTDGLMDGTGMSNTEQRVPRRIRRIQTISLVMLVVCGTINYLDRGALSVANPAIRADLGVSLSEMGLLLSAFAWSYALVQLPVGGLVDRAGPRVLLGIGMTLWSFAQAAGGLVTSFGQFIWARIFLGVGEAPQYPPRPAWLATGSLCGTGACRPAFSTLRPRLARRSPRHC